jgi:hypothetical protein
MSKKEFPITEQEYWEVAGAEYLEKFGDLSPQALVQLLAYADWATALLQGEVADLKERNDFLYKNCPVLVRDQDHKRNKKILEWVEQGYPDRFVSQLSGIYGDKKVTRKVVERVRLESGIKKPIGRPKKPK